MQSSVGLFDIRVVGGRENKGVLATGVGLGGVGAQGR